MIQLLPQALFRQAITTIATRAMIMLMMTTMTHMLVRLFYCAFSGHFVSVTASILHFTYLYSYLVPAYPGFLEKRPLNGCCSCTVIVTNLPS